MIRHFLNIPFVNIYQTELSQLIRFARVCYVEDFNNRNLF